MQCPYCEHSDIVKNGSNRVGTAKYRCKGCLRQFVENPKNKRISAQEKQLVDQLLLEKLPLAGIARVVGVSAPMRQLKDYAPPNSPNLAINWITSVGSV